MKTHPDFRVEAARTHLEHAGKPDELPHSVLVREAIELRRLLGWLLDVADDFVATDPYGSVSQVIDPDGGVYLAPADVHRLPRELVESLKTQRKPDGFASKITKRASRQD